MVQYIEWFNAEWYLQHYPDVASSGMDPAYHYLHHGIKEGRRSGPNLDENFYPSLEDQVSLLNSSQWFVAEWYLSNNRDVANAAVDPAIHYLQHGIAEGRSPNERVENDKLVVLADYRLKLLQDSEWFDSAWYLEQYPDVVEAGIGAEEHYLHYGAAEGRLPGPLFDEGYYLRQLTEPLNQPSGLLHFLVEGEAAGLKPMPSWSDVPWWWNMGSPQVTPINPQTLVSLKQQLPIVIVPVFNAADALADCLESLRKNPQGIGKVIVIDDASTDHQVSELLKTYENDSLFRCVRNEKNLGFSGSVNIGVSLALTADVILLNSDTRVTRGFARRLRLVAYGANRVATVTPLSNNAGVFSVPFSGSNLVPPQFGLDRFALAITQAAVSPPISVPTGHGFCMYIRREALNEAGLFDAEAFPRGYGEENDFCRRAAAIGWSHVIDPRTYVYHHGSASFGVEKADLISAGQVILKQRYPDYMQLVSKAFGGSQIQRLRQQITTLAKMPLSNAGRVRPRVLYVISTLTGGTPQTNQDLMEAVKDEFETFILHCDSSRMSLKHFIDGVYTDIAEHQLSAPIQALPHRSDEYDQAVASWLVEWSIDLIHVRHIAWHSLGLIEVAKSLGIGVIKSFHDFYALCPSVKLLDNNLQFCAANCTRGAGNCTNELWPSDAFYRLKHDQIHEWQMIFSEALLECDAFVTTNQFTKELIVNRYSELAKKPFEVIGHGRDFARFDLLASRPEPKERLRILCPGYIGDAKGLALIRGIASLRQDIELHILGMITKDVDLPENVVICGPYIRGQFLTRVEQIKPHCGAVLSIWPETWCHTLTEMWVAGIPVIGVDMGAVGERITQTGAGWLLPEASVDALADVINHVVVEWEAKLDAVKVWQEGEGKIQDCYKMSEAYSILYKSHIYKRQT